MNALINALFLTSFYNHLIFRIVPFAESINETSVAIYDLEAKVYM